MRVNRIRLLLMVLLLLLGASAIFLAVVGSSLSLQVAAAASGAVAVTAGLLVPILAERQAKSPSVALVGRHRAYVQRVRHSVSSVKNVGLETRPDLVLDLEQVYVEPRLRPLSSVDIAGPSPVTVALGGTLGERDLVGRPGKPVGPFVILGSPGSGKSALLQHLTLSLTNHGGQGGSRLLPIPLILREHASQILETGDDLGQVAASARWLDETFAGWLTSRLAGGRCLVMLDGLDEVLDPSKRDRVVAWIRQQITRHPGNTFIVTSRPHGYESIPLYSAQVLQLEEFSAEQITAFLKAWYYATESEEPQGKQEADASAHARAASQSSDVLARLQSNPSLRALSANPLLLTMIANVDRYRGALPSSRVDLYTEITDVLLFRRQEAKGLADSSGLPDSAKVAALRALALHMMRERLPDVSIEDAIAVLRSTLRRSAKVADARSLLDEATRNGLLVEWGVHRYGFVHIGLQESLAAAEIRDRPGMLSLLTGNVDDPWWRETTVLWAARSDVDPVIEACLVSGTAQALGLAAECADVGHELSPELRHALDARRRQLPSAEADVPATSKTSPSNALIAYVTRADGPETTPGAQLPLDARLLALAEEMRGRLVESSLDLYVASLSVRDPLQSEGVGDVLERYLTLTEGPDGTTGVRTQGWIDTLRDHVRHTGGAFFSLLLPVLAEDMVLREQILDTILADPELAAASASYVHCRPGQDPKTAWGAEIEKWRRERWWLVHGLGDIGRLDLTESSLAGALEAVAEYTARTPLYLHRGLAKITKALTALREFTRAASFEDKEIALRTVMRCATSLSTEIRDAPTALAVEAVAPVAQLLFRLAERESQALLEAHPPRPQLAPALARATVAHDVLTIQVKVSNETDSAPLESAALSVEPDPASLAPVDRPIALPGPVRGGTAQVVLIRMPLARELPASPVAVPVALKYRPRVGPAGLLARTVTFDLMAPGSFTEVPNPYLDWASGRPVAATEMFFGRDEFIDQLRRRLRTAGGPGAGVAIFGQKRSGKSSIRLHLVDRLRTLDGFPVVDVGNISDLSPTSDAKRLIAILMWRIIEGAEQERQSEIPFLPPNLRREEFLASPDPVYDCARLFIDYCAAAPGMPPFVVCLDEFQYVEGWIRAGRVPPSLMQMFKALVERRLFHLVIVGQSDLERVVRDDPNAFGVFSNERISYLDASSARRLIEMPIQMEGQSRYRERAVDRILELTGGNAFFIQRICSYLVDYMNDQGAPLVTEADIDLVSAAFLDRLTEADFDNLESHGQEGFTTAEYRAVLLAVARALEHGQATPESIAEEYDSDRLDEILRELAAHEVIRRDGGAYQIVVGIYRDWLIKYMGPS